uniref:Growth hormone receptor b n=1 Tax=Kryptolebias marmoratus TaxID=37003 RepID=A0A3Q2ZJW3_KRYMA
MAAALGALLLLLHTCSASALRPGPVAPHLTSCVSSNMETFHCRWTVGTFQNLSEPGALRLFYFNRIPPTPFQKNWRECPHYSVETPNECFFSENYTTIWTSYTVRLQSGDRTVLYDEASFDVTDIGELISLHGAELQFDRLALRHYDGLDGAAVRGPVPQRRLRPTDPIKSTQRSLFGLQTDVNHEVRVRCKMLGGKFFGEFSDSVFVHVPAKVSRFPVLALLIFGALCLVAVLMSVIISQQEKLMFLLLPPVPGPKIRGIDSDLLKKGKLRELTSILGGPPDLRPELYNNDPWVEFIDLDIEEQSDKLTDLDMDCLVDRSSCSPPFRDDDSGRSSCCEPELLSESGPSPVHRLDPNQTLGKEPPCQKPSDSSSGGREAVYTMVSEVRASGSVLLSPEEQTETDRNKDIMVGKDKAEQADHRDYTSELHAGKMSPELSKDNLREPFQTGPDPSPALSNMSLSPLPPAPAYTVVDGVDRQNSLLLTLNSAAAPCLTIPKAAPTPDGYLTPELLGSITP